MQTWSLFLFCLNQFLFFMFEKIAWPSFRGQFELRNLTTANNDFTNYDLLEKHLTENQPFSAKTNKTL